MSKNRSWFGWALAFVALVAAKSSAFALDCNTNGVDDTVDISVGTSTDCNSNGVPDECDPNGVRDGVPIYIFVDADAVGNNTGTHFLHAYTDLQDALDVCGTIPCGGDGIEIWVAEGTYHPAFSTDPLSRRASFEVCTNVRLYGGFDGTENPSTFDMDDRDLEANETILSGDLDDDDDTTGTSENSYTDA